MWCVPPPQLSRHVLQFQTVPLESESNWNWVTCTGLCAERGCSDGEIIWFYPVCICGRGYREFRTHSLTVPSKNRRFRKNKERNDRTATRLVHVSVLNKLHMLSCSHAHLKLEVVSLGNRQQ